MSSVEHTDQAVEIVFGYDEGKHTEALGTNLRGVSMQSFHPSVEVFYEAVMKSGATTYKKYKRAFKLQSFCKGFIL